MKLARIGLSVPLLQEILTTGWRAGFETRMETRDALPPGAELVRTYYDEASGTAWLVFAHESFQDVALGMDIPMLLPVTYTEHIASCIRCAECKWWPDDGGPSDGSEKRPCMASSSLFTVEGDLLYTAPTFGCVVGERK